MVSFDRTMLKTNAKAVLKRIYGSALLMLLLMSVIGGAVGIVAAPIAIAVPFLQISGSNVAEMVIAIVLLILLLYVLMFAFIIFVIMPLNVGMRKFYNTTTFGEDEVSTLFYAFKKGNGYLNIVKTQFLTGLYLFLWALIPVAGYFIMIYKMYSYYLVPFILADNPHMPASRAIRLSEQMMHGRRFEMFVLELSFLGWILLGLLAFSIGVYFVYPYIYATDAQFYMHASLDAINRGITTREELGLSAASPAYDPQYAPSSQDTPSGFGDNF